MKQTLIRIINKRILHNARKRVRSKRYVSILDAHKVGFIFNVDDPSVSDAVSYLRNLLKASNISFKAIAMDLKESSEGVPMYQYDPNVINFYISDINWYGLPIHPLAGEFINEPFDILIDLSINRSFSIDYIIESSVASLKVGAFRLKEPSFDLIIESGERPFSLLNYVENAVNYLSSIKTL